MNQIFLKLSVCTILLSSIVGCSMVTPLERYKVSEANVDLLTKHQNISAAVGEFKRGPAHELNCDPISIRAMTLVSPYENSFAKYIEEALKLELSLAGKYDPKADVEVTGVVLKNDMSTAGHGIIEVTFRVTKNNVVKYEATHLSTGRWRKAFAGSAAYGLAFNNYNPMVSKLLFKLFSDPRFIESITK